MKNDNILIGRIHEKEILQLCTDSAKAEFVAIYGRRRIGKTFLVKQFFNEKFDFYTSGVYQIPRMEQLKRWQAQLQKYSGVKRPRPKDWFEAFDQLEEYLNTLSAKEKLVIFIDELPWLDTPKSGFIRALEVFWNSWASDRNGLKLIVCGSATTWMTNKLLGDKGGLHNRVTRPIRLAPFTLSETEEYLQHMGFEWSRSEILDAYMILGGTPFYLSLLRPELSLRQNIDELFFGRDAVLRSEYEFMFSSLFSSANTYRHVVETLSSKMKGLTRTELVAEMKIADSGMVSEVLDNLEKCDFIRRYKAFGKKNRDSIYQLSDMYTLFYLRFVKRTGTTSENYWSTLSDVKRNTWAGYAFEQVCMLHASQIKQALGISGIASEQCAWNCDGAQIDMIIDRADKVINLCEMKFSNTQYEISGDYALWLKERREIFRQSTGTNKTLHLTLVSPYGVKPGKNSFVIQNTVEMDDLFK
ncbi:MAG: ATP-binding protein [Paludibacteraceae bacterium]|nr:ATP-binding protein [Paludibacteraceae bacterium]